MVYVTAMELVRDATVPVSGAPPAKRHRWPIWAVAAVVIVGGSLWYGLGRAGGISRTEALAACAASIGGDPLTPLTTVKPVAVGVGRGLLSV